MTVIFVFGNDFLILKIPGIIVINAFIAGEDAGGRISRNLLMWVFFLSTNTSGSRQNRALPVCRWHFHILLLEWELMDLDSNFSIWQPLTHWSRVTHLCDSKLTNIGLDNGLSPVGRLIIIWIHAGILLIGSLGTNFSEILIGIQTFSFKKMHMKMPFVKCVKGLRSIIGLDART